MRIITECPGRAFHLPGDDIDTDRIMPARYLKMVTFAGLEKHVFEDARSDARAKGSVHPFDDLKNKDCSILVVDANFGSGSSREHAPQGLMRWGIKALIGNSFANIFRGNCRANGIICVDLAPEDHAYLVARIEEGNQDVLIDLESMEIIAGNLRMKCTMPSSDRTVLLEGTWDPVAALLASEDQLKQTETKLPPIRTAA